VEVEAQSMTAVNTTADLMLALDDIDDDVVLDLPAIFGNDDPVEIELGIGKGRYLLGAAKSHTDVNYIGVEVAIKYLRLACDRAGRRQLNNIRFVHGDAREFVEFFLPSESVQAFHIYFPDPWPKKRHHKRRLMSPDFVREVHRVLVPGGRVWIKTDHSDYFEAMLEALAPFADQLVPVEAAWSGEPTNFEVKYVSAGRSIHRRVLQKATP
jgi:tRNA (guanine-N7-)-methyltransferase